MYVTSKLIALANKWIPDEMKKKLLKVYAKYTAASQKRADLKAEQQS